MKTMPTGLGRDVEVHWVLWLVGLRLLAVGGSNIQSF